MSNQPAYIYAPYIPIYKPTGLAEIAKMAADMLDEERERLGLIELVRDHLSNHMVVEERRIAGYILNRKALIISPTDGLRIKVSVDKQRGLLCVNLEAEFSHRGERIWVARLNFDIHNPCMLDEILSTISHLKKTKAERG